MFTPTAPSAGPTGGEGLAAPPLTCNFTILLTSLAITYICFRNYLFEIGSINVSTK
jgi:hypothetical protein